MDGFRHAILSQDDPYCQKLKRRRPTSSSSYTTNKTSSRLSHHKDEVEDCLRKLNLVVKSRKSHITKRPKSSNEPDIERLNLTDIDDSEQELVLKASPQPLNESGRYDFYTMKNMRNNKTARPDVKENTELSDRVLQWLDLAGKIDLLAPENTERMSQPRHSWPELQRRHNLLKSKTAIDIRSKEATKHQSPKGGDSPKAQQNSNIDRHDVYVPTSANTIENYARQSRNIKITPRVEIQAKTRENTVKTKLTQGKPNVQETRQKVATERSAVEKQYAEMVSKKLIPDVSKTVKKQVHIFMPEMLKKSPTSVMSTTTTRTGSILSMQPHKILSK